MSFAARANASAARLVKHFGEGLEVTIKSIAGTFTPATRSFSPSISSMTVPCTEPTPLWKRLENGQRVQTGELRISIQDAHPARTFDPAPEMVAEIRGRAYRVADVLVEAGGFELHLAGAA